MQILFDYFIISVFITLLILYLISPKPRVVLKYPNIKNEVSDLYVDDNGICYRYHRSHVACPSDPSNTMENK